MNWNYKTDNYYIEKYLGVFLGVILGSFSFSGKINDNSIIASVISFPPIGVTVFGFLLTLLGIIIQGNSEQLNKIKKREVLYARILKMNKKIVFTSFLISVFSILFNIIFSTMPTYFIYKYIVKFILALYIGSVSMLFIDLFYFLRIFYILILPPK